ncbi:hypothetical protein ACFL0Q_01230 [Thermodesulfobacteriota bacterium]
MMNTKLTNIFRIMSFFDDYRWEFSDNYNLINFFKKDLEADIKILTHWLCYITDRQMPFKRIWDIGGFVFSELIYEVKKQKSLELLKPGYDHSFVRMDYGNDKYTLLSKSTGDTNSILTRYNGIFENGRVTFKSRFFPSDYLAILNTLVFLEDCDFSFSKFIKHIYCKHKDKHDFIKRILFSFYLLPYYEIGQPKSSDLSDFAGNIERANERENRINNLLNNSDQFSNKYNLFLKNTVFNQKRAWCSLSDFLKSPEFKRYFEEALTKEGLGYNAFRKLFSYEALIQLELPGDVWNNNATFRKCILKDTVYAKSKKTLNRIVRDFLIRTISILLAIPNNSISLLTLFQECVI